MFAVHIPIIGLALVPTLLHWPALLLPVHIVLLELVIDPACSVVFEAEPETEGLMERAPRPVTDSPFGAAPIIQSVVQGLGIAAVLLAGQAWLVAHGWSAEQGRSVVFGTLVVSVVLLILANRDLSRPAWFGVTDRNPWLWRMVVVVGLLLIAIASVPWLRQVMGLASPTPKGLAVGLVLLAACTAWLEWVRRISRSRIAALDQ